MIFGFRKNVSNVKKGFWATLFILITKIVSITTVILKPE